MFATAAWQRKVEERTLKSIWSDRWARVAALIIVGAGAIALALEVAPLAGGVVDMIGFTWTVLLGVGALVAAIVLLFPGWWPLWRARRANLSNPWVFTLVS